MQKRQSTFFPSTRRLVFALAVLAAAAVLGLYAAYSPWVANHGSGIALVGGPFEMVNQDGAKISEKDFAGKPVLLFFGYTYCPDVCPTELQIMATALEQLGDSAKDVQPVFVTIDPDRDKPDVLKSYLSSFGPRWSGLTGTPDQVAAMARKWHVYYEKRENKDSPENYLMDHSSFVFLMGPDGRFIKHFNYTTDAKAFANDLLAALKSG